MSRTKRKGSNSDPASDPTFPERLRPLAEKFYQQARVHPTFVLLSPTELRQSIENRLWSVVANFPMWWGCGEATKREATAAQLAALAKARQAKVVLTEESQLRERAVNERVQAEITA